MSFEASKTQQTKKNRSLPHPRLEICTTISSFKDFETPWFWVSLKHFIEKMQLLINDQWFLAVGLKCRIFNCFDLSAEFQLSTVRYVNPLSPPHTHTFLLTARDSCTYPVAGHIKHRTWHSSHPTPNISSTDTVHNCSEIGWIGWIGWIDRHWSDPLPLY